MFCSIRALIDAIQAAEEPRQRRIGVAQLLGLIVALFGSLFSLFHLLLGDIQGSILLFVFSATAWQLSQQVPRLGSVWITNLLALLMTLTLLYFQLGLDGLHAPHAAWYSLPPILALLGANRRSAIFWLLSIVLLQWHIFAAHREGLQLVSPYLPQLSAADRDIDTLVVQIGQIVALLVIVWAIETAREVAFARLQVQREELARLNGTLEARIEAEVEARISAERDYEWEIEHTQKEIIMTMGTICEGRSQETANHVRRVAEYSALLARLIGLSGAEQELLRIASPMHDIGKVAIPDAILHKPGRLSEAEYAEMTAHAALGYEMLRGSSRPIIQAAAIIAHQHHEKYDGSGYPKRLAGEQIHIYGRITALADVFDALGSERIYKRAWPLERILAFIREQKGRHFDPTLVELFFEQLDEFLLIQNCYRDTATEVIGS